jgi:O-antigen/teichoic acid export membrane protein
VLGDRWRSAIIVIQVMSINAAINQIGFNWSTFYRATGDTRPTAVSSFIVLAGTIGLAIPLLLIDGLRGYAIGMGLVTVIYVCVRFYYLRRLFSSFRLVSHMARGLAPSVPAIASVLLMRAFGAPFTAGWIVAELAVFGILVLVATLIAERSLLGEFVGYLRRPAPEPAV